MGPARENLLTVVFDSDRRGNMRFLNISINPPPISRNELGALKHGFENVGKAHGLDLLAIYGSLAKDRMGPLSDIDVAFLKSGRTTMGELTAILGDLQALLEREDIDITDLSEANPLLKMCILKDSIFVYSSSEAKLVEFRYKTISEFLATQYLRSQFSHYLRRAVLGRKYGSN